MLKKVAKNLLGIVIILFSFAMFMVYATYSYNKARERVLHYAADYINETCGTELTGYDVILQSEGMDKWFILAPVNHMCMSTDEGEYDMWLVPNSRR